MSIGQAIRRIAGRHEEALCRLYRRIFVNVEDVASHVAAIVPRGAHVLEVGGGDGMLMNALLDLRPDITADLIDIAESVGTMVTPANLPRVGLHPATPMAAFHGRQADVVLVCDVMHHIPVEERRAFLAEAFALAGPGTLVVKDIAPHHPRSWLGYLSDRFVSNVPVSLVSPSAVHRLAGGRMSRVRTGIGVCNYVVALQR